MQTRVLLPGTIVVGKGTWLNRYSGTQVPTLVDARYLHSERGHAILTPMEKIFDQRTVQTGMA